MATEIRPRRDGAPPDDLPVADLIGQGLVERFLGVAGRPTRPPIAPTEAPTPARAPALGPREVRARWRTFRAYWFGHLTSMIGDHMTLVALPIAAQRLTGSSFVVGLIVSAETLATVLFGMTAGALTDRRHPRPVMVWTDLGRAALLALVAVLGWRSLEPVALLVVASFALGLLRLLHDGAESALVARLVPDELDVRSNNRLNLSENIGLTLGPLLAGAAISVSAWLALGIDAATFVVAAVAVAMVGRLSRRRHVELAPAPTVGPAPRLHHEFGATWRAIRAKRVYRRALVVMAVGNVAALPLGPQFVTLASDELGLGPVGIGSMFAVAGVAGILAAPFLERSDEIRPGVVIAGTALFSVAITAVGIAPSVPMAALAFVTLGVGITASMTHYSALRQRVYPADQQGRIALTSRVILWSILPVGALGGGALAEVAGNEAMWLACGAAGLAVVAWGLAVGLAREPVEAPPVSTTSPA